MILLLVRLCLWFLGVPLTNAARDLVSGNLISGPTRGIEAILTAVSIGSAIVIVLHFN